jgi:hypothetical protein
LIERDVVLMADNTIDVTLNGGGKDSLITVSLRRHIEVTAPVLAETKLTTTGQSDTFRRSFDAAEITGDFRLIVVNGPGGAAQIKSGSIVLNGTEVVSKQELKSGIAKLVKIVTLEAVNELVASTQSDGAGAAISVAVVQSLIDTTGPVLILTGLTDGQVVPSSSLAVAGTVTDVSGIASLTVNGNAVTPAAGGAFQTSLPLVAGPNALTVVATDCEGNVTRRDLTIVLSTGPAVTILTPAANAISSTAAVVLSGTASGGVTAVTANGTAMTLTGNTWSGNLTLPADGVHTITVTGTAGNIAAATASVQITVDTTKPAVAIGYPDSAMRFAAPLQVSGPVTDATSGIAGVTCDGGAAQIVGDMFQCGVTLQPGANTMVVVATDKAGHTSEARKTIEYFVDSAPPTISAVITPAPNGAGWVGSTAEVSFVCTDDSAGGAECSQTFLLFSDGAAQRVTGTATDAGGNTATATVFVNIDNGDPAVVIDQGVEAFGGETLRLTGTAFDGVSGVAGVSCNGVAATMNGNAFDCTVTLTERVEVVDVVVTDLAGNYNKAGVVATRDVEAPVVEIVSPASALVTNDRIVAFDVAVSDDDRIASVKINGVDAFRNGELYSAEVPLSVGSHEVTVEARDRVGNTGTAAATVQVLDRFAIEITTPADFAVVRASSVTVIGTVAGTVTTLDVNGVAAQVSGGTFTAPNVPLAQGRTVVTATAGTPAGQVVTSSINLYRDSIPPRVEVYSPEQGEVSAFGTISVSGMVDDIVIGTINSGQVQVTVNGVAATVANRAFIARDVTLQPGGGGNTLAIVATDQAGNTSTSTRTVYFEPNRPRIVVVSGDGQTAPIRSELPSPLRLRAVNATGAPVANLEVDVAIVQNDGTLTAADQTGRSITVTTDAAGEATFRWTLGGRAGAGNHRLLASAVGYGFGHFHAVGQTGSPAMVVVDSGTNQFGVSGERLPRPLVAVVVDDGSNRLAGRDVRFDVVEGGGSFEGGASTIVVPTDSDGRAWVTPILGPGSGSDNNRFSASLAGVDQVAVFSATGRPAGPPEQTRLSGVVVDNSNIPIAGVTLRIDETTRSTTTNAQGQFAFDAAPVGYVKLIVDGSTAQRDGTWPMLEFVMYTNAGQDNTIGMPIYLLPIDVTRGIQVTETTGGTLTFPELPGFSLKVAPGSALFPNGSRAGTVSATLVHADKMPMTPGFGQQPRFIVTIQPPGVHFDPPAAMTLPNLDGMAPGEITEMYSFDHDLGQFVAIGTGTVSEDGSTIESDPGVGIIKGGWHCGGNPNPTGTSSCLTVRAEVVLDPPEPSPSAMSVSTESARAPRRVVSNAVASTKVASVGGCAKITAYGLPVLPGLVYTGWEFLANPIGATWVTNAACNGTPSCSAVIRANSPGTVWVRVKYTNGGTSSTTEDVQIQFVRLVPSVTEVKFVGDTVINRDQPSAAIKVVPVPDLVWSATATTPAEPVLIMPGDDVDIVAKFAINPPLPATMLGVLFEASIPGKGKWSGTANVPAGASEVTVNLKEGGWTATPTSQNHGPLAIHFSAHPASLISVCPQTISAGLANVPFFSTLGRLSTSVFLSTLHIATDGPVATTSGQGFSKVWAKFSSRSVKSWEGSTRPLIYYPAGKGFDFTVPGSEEELLKAPDGGGRCGAFAPLMASALVMNGVTSTLVVVDPSAGMRSMLVKNWTAVATTFPAEPLFKWRFKVSPNSGGYDIGMVPAPGPGANRYGDLRSDSGAPGQNESTPAEKAHYNHAILKVNGLYYDSSYGLTYSNQLDFQSQAIWGYTIRDSGGTASESFARQVGTDTIVRFSEIATYAPVVVPPPAPVKPPAPQERQ